MRFAVLAEAALARPDSSVLDVGCGFADLYDWLSARGWRGRYVGIDIVPGLLAVARTRHPGLTLLDLDLAEAAATTGPHDFVIASGVFNARLSHGDNREHITAALGLMLSMARIGVMVDFLSADVDFQKEGAWHTDPAWAFRAAKALTRRVALRHDYMPFEFALFLHRDDRVSPRNVFLAAEPAAP